MITQQPSMALKIKIHLLKTTVVRQTRNHKNRLLIAYANSTDKLNSKIEFKGIVNIVNNVNQI